jgi:hypothetical protein
LILKLSVTVMYYALQVGFLDVGDRLLGSTLLYINLVLDALLLYD